MVRLTPEQTRVTFVIRCQTAFGQRLRIVGNDPSLGGWDPLRGIELTTSQGDYPKWRISLTLPANRTLEYKYICIDAPTDDTDGASVHSSVSGNSSMPNILALRGLGVGGEQDAGAAQGLETPGGVAAAAGDPSGDAASDAIGASRDAVKETAPAAPQLEAALESRSSASPTAFSSSAVQQVLAGNAYWEPFEANRVVDTEPGATMVVDEGDFGILNNTAETRVQTVSRGLSRQSREKDLDGEGRNSSGLVSPLSGGTTNEPDTLIIVLYRLPIIAEKRDDGWHFDWDDDALYLTSTGLRRGLEDLSIQPLWIGILPTEIDVPLKERDEISAKLYHDFRCVPVFLPRSTIVKFYQGFCKGTLWPAFHMITNVMGPEGTTPRFDEDSWHAYQRVNRSFSKVVIEHYDRHLIWVHDYHLMLLPYYLRIKLSGVKIGFFLHIPWPSSEIFRMLPVRNEILKGLLSSTLLGFHLFDYARHFLSACVRLLNLEHEARRGSLGIDYEGRHVMIRVSHIGVDSSRFTERLGMSHLREKAAELESKYPNITLLGAIDDLDIVKGIALKLIAFENYLASSSENIRPKVALIQVAIPKTARVDHAVRDEIRGLVAHINNKYGTHDHQPVHYIEDQISFDERMAVYAVCDALLLTPIRDGLNLIPYEYIVSTPQGKGQLILSEFTGCSRALSSAVRVNPWNVNELRDVIDNVVQKCETGAAEIRLKHEADRKYVTMHSSATWADSFLGDLKEASEVVREVVRLGLGVGVGFRRLEFDDFSMLNAREVVKAYRESKNKLFLFDYDGTLTTIGARMAHTWAKPTEDVMRSLTTLSKEENCTVVIVSGRSKDTEGFKVDPSIGIAAEHGFYYKKPNSSVWEELEPDADLSWIDIASRIMQLYTERTDGSYIEEKTAGIVWHYLAADPEFGGWQAKEMHDHLESILATFNVQVVNGHGWLQVRLASVNKGNMVNYVLSNMPADGQPDFVFCCGDDRTDEDMFNRLKQHEATKHSHLFTTTVGVKPSNARYYLRSSMEVGQLIEQIIEVTHPGSATHVRSSTLEDLRPAALRRLVESTGNGMGGLTLSASSGALDADS
jgi:trehalose 6-phosphate synthase/phosphatase